MKHRFAAIAMATALFAAATLSPLAPAAMAQSTTDTVKVTPSNPHGWTESTYYTAPSSSGYETPAPAGVASSQITNSNPRSGNGSLAINLADAGNSEADFGMQLATPHALDSLTALSYDWFRSSSSTTGSGLMTAFALDLGNNNYLMWERAYNATGNVPVDQWVTSNILNGNFWLSTAGGGTCSSAQVYTTLAYFNQNCFNNQAQVQGVYITLGYAAPGSYYGNADNVRIGFGAAADTTFNFEADQLTTTPEPSSMALLGSGLFGIAPFLKRRKKSLVA